MKPDQQFNAPTQRRRGRKERKKRRNSNLCLAPLSHAFLGEGLGVRGSSARNQINSSTQRRKDAEEEKKGKAPQFKPVPRSPLPRFFGRGAGGEGLFRMKPDQLFNAQTQRRKDEKREQADRSLSVEELSIRAFETLSPPCLSFPRRRESSFFRGACCFQSKAPRKALDSRHRGNDGEPWARRTNRTTTKAHQTGIPVPLLASPAPLSVVERD